MELPPDETKHKDVWVYVSSQNPAEDAFRRLTLDEGARKKHQVIAVDDKQALLVSQYLTSNVVVGEEGLKVEVAYVLQERRASPFMQQQYVLERVPQSDRRLLDEIVRRTFAPEPVDAIHYDWSPK